MKSNNNINKSHNLCFAGVTSPEETKRHIEAMVQQFMPFHLMTSMPVQYSPSSPVTCPDSQSQLDTLPLRKS